MAEHSEEPQRPTQNVYDVDASDPESRLIDREAHSPETSAQIGELMAALAELRAVEQQLSDASQRYMKLGQTDMKALHFLIVARHTDTIATPGAIAQHLEISTASTTKLLDRLEAGGHVLRAPHPSDRRALAITITEATYEAAMDTVGQQQAKRFHAAARLSPAEREIVIGFLRDMTKEIRIQEGQ